MRGAGDRPSRFKEVQMGKIKFYEVNAEYISKEPDANYRDLLIQEYVYSDPGLY
jgi:hypothetical protein